MPVEIHVTGVF